MDTQEKELETCVHLVYTLSRLDTLSWNEASVLNQSVLLIYDVLTKRCLRALPGIHQIPRAYRQVKDSRVEGPMPYVAELLSPLADFYEKYKDFVTLGVWRAWVVKIVDPLIENYADLLERLLLDEEKKETLLNSVKKLPDLTSCPDTEKMREQVRVDIAIFIKILYLNHGLYMDAFKANKLITLSLVHTK